jgi:hypothetical protein
MSKSQNHHALPIKVVSGDVGTATKLDDQLTESRQQALNWSADFWIVRELARGVTDNQSSTLCSLLALRLQEFSESLKVSQCSG